MQTELKQITSILLFLTLFLNSVPEGLSAQVESANSDRPHRLLPQAGPGARALRGARGPEEVEISAGFVFLNGQYVCPPYTIASAGNEVSLNGIVLPVLSLTRSNQRMHFQRRGRRMPPQRLVGWLKQSLAQDGLLIHLDENTMTMIPCYQALPILDTLLSSQSLEEKIKGCTQQELTGFSLEQWAYLVDGFEASPEILDRVALLRETQAEQQELGGKTPWYSGLRT